MKRFTKLTFSLLLSGLLVVFTSNLTAQVNYALDNNCGTGVLEVYFNPGASYASTTDWNPCQFTIEVPAGQAGAIGAITSFNGFNFSAQNSGTSGGSFYQVYAHAGANQLALTSGVQVKVAEITLVGTIGTFLTSVQIPGSSDAWAIANNGLSIITANPPGANQVPGTYSAFTLTGVPLFAGVIWDGTTWCGGSQANGEPGAADAALNCYVTGPGGTITFATGVVNQLNIYAGADLTIDGSAGAALTASGPTFINDPQGLKVTADPLGSGTGSFIDNGTITYGASGSATVEAYLLNTPAPVTLHMHLIGPMVDNPTFAFPPLPTQPGVFLSEFDLLSGGTYAYRYDEPTNAWANIFQSTDPVPAMHGIAMSDNSSVSKVLIQSGNLNTGTLSSLSGLVVGTPWALSYTAPGTGGGDGNALLSNPYPSGLDLGALWAANPFAFFGNPTAYIWQHGLSGGVTYGNYATWNTSTNTGTGLMSASGGLVSPGQGFFGQLSSTFWGAGGSPGIAFNNTMRQHYHAPFVKSEHLNLLRVKVEGNMTQDDLLVYFFGDPATSSFDTLDALKWESMYEGATQIMTLSEDGERLTQNIMPSLGVEAVTIPMNFKCGATEEYTLTATEIETFMAGTEIYLEDLLTGGDWQLLNSNPVYTFSASPDDPEGRFLLHFFGPTGIEEPGAAEAIKIYSHKEYAYIMNDGSEEIEEFIVYDMMGHEVIRGTLPSSSLNKIYIGDNTAYYVVQVITKGRTYNGKVLITK